MKNLIIPFLLMSQLANSQEQKNYEVKKFDELQFIESNQNVVDRFKDSISGAYITTLGNGQFILMPAEGSLGLLVKSKDALDSIIKSAIPLPEQNETPFHRYRREEIQQMVLMSEPYILQMFEKLGMERGFDITSESDIKRLDAKIKKFGYEQFYDNLYIQFGLFIGEELRRKYKLEWTLKKRYAVNPFYEPLLKTENGDLISPFYKLADMVLIKKKFSLKKYYDQLFFFIKAYDVTLNEKK